MSPHVLIADDDRPLRTCLAELLGAAGVRTSEAASGHETLEVARSGLPDLVLLDLDMPAGSGLDVLPELTSLDGAPAVVILTGIADVRTTVRAMRGGASDLLEKPVEPARLMDAIRRALEGREAIADGSQEVASMAAVPVVGSSTGIRRVLQHVQRVAATPRTTALVTGESGVGKELVARAVHDQSNRADGPFVPVNCAALADGLLEAELFGYEPGAFTGGNPAGHEGLAAAAEGGTLFLDEVGELEPQLQAKLLRVLQERSYRRVGGNVDLPMDVRIVASTNRDLVSMVEEGTFREDLFYRLNVLSIDVPPLRERPEDIAPIALHFLAEFGNELSRSFTGFSEAALERLRRHTWPGNVRELKNAIERGAILAQEGQILSEHLGLEASRTAGPAGARDGHLPLDGWSLKGMEKRLIQRALDEFEGNRSRAARELGINRTTLYNKLRSYGISD